MIRKLSARHKSGQNQSIPFIEASMSNKVSNCSRIVVGTCCNQRPTDRPTNKLAVMLTNKAACLLLKIRPYAQLRIYSVGI